MWCDNCLLLFPLRAGGMAWAVVIFLYSAIGGALLFEYGQFWFFTSPYWDIYGAIALFAALAALIQVFALANRSFVWCRVCHFLWPVSIIVCAIRDVIMVIQLHSGESNINWECANGGQLWPAAQDPLDPTTKTLPTQFCNAGYSSFYTAFIIGILVDIGFQLYMLFLNWRFLKRFRHYADMKPIAEGMYA